MNNTGSTKIQLVYSYIIVSWHLKKKSTQELILNFKIFFKNIPAIYRTIESSPNKETEDISDKQTNNLRNVTKIIDTFFWVGMSKESVGHFFSLDNVPCCYMAGELGSKSTGPNDL